MKNLVNRASLGAKKNLILKKIKWLLVPLVLLTLGAGNAWGAPQSVSYTFTSKAFATSANAWTCNTEGNSFANSGVQCTTGKRGKATTKSSISNISKIIVTYCTNASSGAGSIKIKIGSNGETSQTITKTGGTTPRTVTFNYDTPQTGTVALRGYTTTNSIYIIGIQIFYGYTVKYNNNGGSGTMTDDNSPYASGASVTVKSNTFTAPSGKVFDSWNTASGGGGTKYAAGASFTISAHTTLYAQWKDACTELGTINGSVSLSQLASPDPTKLKATWTMNATTGISSYNLEVYNSSDVLVKTVNGYTSGSEITGLTPCTTYYVKLYTVSSGGDYCAGGLISTSSTCTTNGYTITYTKTNVSKSSGTEVTNQCSADEVDVYYAADDGYNLPATITVTNAGEEDEDWSWDSGTGELIILDLTAITGNVTVTITGVSAGCSGQYCIDSYDTGGNGMSCFTGASTSRTISNYVIPSSYLDDRNTDFWVGYGGSWVSGKSANWHFRWIPLKDRPGGCSMTLGVAAQAIGTLTINSGTAGSDNNYELTFDPNGYGFVYGSGVSWSNKAFVQQADPTVWRTGTFALTSAEIGKNYYVGLAKSGGGYVKTLDYEYNDADEHIWGPSYESTISGMGVASGKSAGNVTFRGSGLSTPSDDGMRGFYEIWSNNCNRNFYCHFVPVHRIIYDANWPAGASGVEPSDTYSSDVPVIESNNITVPAAPSAPTVGYHFVEWNTASNGSGTGYDPGDTYTIAVGTGADITLHAIWEKDVYTITKTLTNVSCTPTIPSTYTYTGSAAGLSYTFTANSGYALPSSVTVSGTTYTWNQATGVLSLTGTITGNVSITIVGVTADTYIDLMHGAENATQVFTSSYTVPTFTTAATGSTCEGTHKYFAGFSNSINSTTIVKEAGATGQTPSGATYYAVWGDGVPGWTQVTDLSELTTGKTFLIVGNGDTKYLMSSTITSSRFANASVGTITISGTTLTTTNDIPDGAKWSIYKSGDYYLIKQGTNYAAGTATYKQGAMISDNTSNYAKWSVSVSTGVFTFENYGRSIAETNNTYKYLRSNGTYGFACYTTGTGSAQLIFTESGGIDYKTKCCADAAVVTLSPSSQTVYKDIDGNAAATIGFSQTGGGAGSWGTPTVDPSGPTVTKVGSNINFSHTATGTYTVTIGYTETCEKTGSATVTVAERGIIAASGTTTFSPTCGTPTAGSDITVNSRYLAGSTITASIATSTGSGNFTISTDNSTFNTSNKSISGGTSSKVTSHIYVRYEPAADETGSIAGTLTLTCGGKTETVSLSGTVTCGCNIRFTSAADLVQITAANGIWVQANSELALSGSFLKTNADDANVSIRAYTNNAHFQLKGHDVAGEGAAKTSTSNALSLATNESSNTANGWTGSIGIVYKPAAHNTTETATLTVEVYRYGGSTVYSTATYTLYGRSLPENFVIAVTDGSGHWFAIPADMVAPWGNSCSSGLSTYTPYPIEVNNTTTPTAISGSTPSRAVYTAAARTGNANTNPQTLSFKSVPLAGSGNYYLYGSVSAEGSATNIQNASNAASEKQKWFLDVIDWSTKKYNMHLASDLNTNLLSYYTGNVGQYSASGKKADIYILPATSTCTNYIAPKNITCAGIDATNYTIQFKPDRTKNYEISLNGSSWSDVTTSIVNECTDDEHPTLVSAQLPLATYRGQTVYIRVKDAGGCAESTTFAVPNPNVTVNAGTWMTMSGIAGYAFNNTANSVTISGLASCGDQNVSVSSSNDKISASVNQSTGVVTISMTAGNATAGTHTAQLTFTLTGGTTRTQNISITLTAKATQTWDGGDNSHFWNGMLCDEEGILVNPTVYLSYDMYYNGSRISTIGDFNSYSTIYLKDLNTGTNVTAHSMTRLKASDGVYGVDLINLTSYRDLIVGHKYRLVWENHSEDNSIQDAVTNSSGVPYSDCHMDFVYTQDCSSPTLLPGCASGTTADVSWGNTSASCSNYTLEWFDRTESSLTNTSIKDNTSNLIIWAYGASCYEANNNYLDDWIVSNNSSDYKSATYGYQVGGTSVKNYIFTPRLNQLYASAGTSTVYEVTVTLQNTGTANAYAAQCYAVDNTSSSTTVITSGYSATYNGVSTTYFVTPACPISSTITSTFKVTGLTATSRIGFTCQTQGQKLYVKNVAIKRLVDGDHSSATIAKSEDSYTITGLTTGKTYYATLTCGSSTSNEITFTTASGTPSVAFYSDAGFTSAITEADVVPGTPKTVYVRGTNVYFCGEEIPVTINSCFNIDSKSLEYNSETHVLEGNITVSNICAAADGPLTVSISGDHELLLHCTGDHQIEVVQWATNGLKIESYVIVSGTPSSGALNVTTSGGTYDLSHASLDITAHANEYLKITWNGRVENFRVPVFINSSCNSSTLSNVTEESVIVVNANKTLTINSDLVCAGVEIYPMAKVQFSSGSLTADYIRLYNNGDTWANFAKLDVTGASTISVDNVYADFRINEDRYHYIALPFDIETDDVTYAAPIPNGGTPALRDATNNRAFYVRQYDGRARETNDKATETTYNVNMPHIGAKGGNYAMTAGRGYMIAIGDQATATGHAKRTLRFPIAMTSSEWTAEKASSKVVGGAWVADGSDNGSARATNKGWNLVGNPFMRELTVTSTSGGMSTGYLDETGGTPIWQITDDGVRYITIYNAATDAFTYQPLNVSFTLKPMAAFYLQMKNAKYINFQAGMVGQAAAMPGLMRSDSQVEEEVNVIISLSNADQADKAGIVLHSKYDVAYNEADDADYPKLMSGTQVALWSIASEEPLASNGLPKTATENIPLGFQAPQTGQYTFALDVDGCDMKWLKHVWLTDLEKNISRDLLLETYEFEEAQTEKREDRFLLGVELFSKEEIAEGTEIIDANNERPQKFIWQDKMYILRGGVIYDATGKRVGEINK